jgi:hypothetical protein
MPFDKHEEKEYPQHAPSEYAAALKAVETLEGKIATESPENFQFEAKFPKTILKNMVGEQHPSDLCSGLAGRVQPGGGEAYTLDALEHKLMLDARKGVTQSVVTWFMAHLEHHLGKIE